MDYSIRELRQNESKVLNTFLYEAIFIPEGVPVPLSFAISLLKQYRNYGIGINLMEQILKKLKMQGYKQASLSVQKMNYAVHMYLKVGFEIIDENDEEYIMICKL